MTSLCLRCGRPVEDRFRLVMGRGTMERLCTNCAEGLSALVRVAGESCRLSVADARFSAWLDTGRWLTSDGRSLGPEDIPPIQPAIECPCCAAFAEEEN